MNSMIDILKFIGVFVVLCLCGVAVMVIGGLLSALLFYLTITFGWAAFVAAVVILAALVALWCLRW